MLIIFVLSTLFFNFCLYIFLVISSGDQPKPLYAQLFKSGGRSSETHSETPQSVSAPSQNYSTPSLPPKSTSPVCFELVN